MGYDFIFRNPYCQIFIIINNKMVGNLTGHFLLVDKSNRKQKLLDHVL